MVDEARKRILRNRARAWAFAAARLTASVASITNVQYDFAGGGMSVGSTYGDFTATGGSAGSPVLTDIGTTISIFRTVGATEYFTTASISVGTASANRRVFLAGTVDSTFNGRLVTASIGGVAMTLHAASQVTIGENIGTIFIASALVPSGNIVGFSSSWTNGFANGIFRARVFTADNSLFINPSPTVAFGSTSLGATGSTFLTATTSANAIVIGVTRGAVIASQDITVSSNVAVLTQFDPGGFTNRIFYGNSVSAQVTVVETRQVTATDHTALALLIWR